MVRPSTYMEKCDHILVLTGIDTSRFYAKYHILSALEPQPGPKTDPDDIVGAASHKPTPVNLSGINSDNSAVFITEEGGFENTGDCANLYLSFGRDYRALVTTLLSSRVSQPDFKDALDVEPAHYTDKNGLTTAEPEIGGLITYKSPTLDGRQRHTW
ncbi:uncharacterized protein BJ212DRAFT_1294306 [Suillus subaureus]|uniref:Uncharacterized protein n=1 Tax=Suillus subaureus TaxID=48587 RepID=A0A9P7ENF5_9AGAM|nr:uncharacterized protein BJ212DRAFT_1294306 [Suillus subaureus]KAG1826878.1 hypothetical protein BJ212DRAFT_1294306 [Suillus subaureus]